MKFLYVVIIIMVSLSVFFTWNFFFGGPSESEIEQVYVDFATSTIEVESSTKLKVQTRDGNVVYSTQDVTLDSYQSLTDYTKALYDADDLLITYYEPEHRLIVQLFAEPLAETRAKAENFIISEFGFSQEQMCAMSATVITNAYVNEYYGGVQLGFSFCEGSAQL